MSQGRRWQRCLPPIVAILLMMMLVPDLASSSTTTFVYSTDFEDVTRRDAHHLNMGINNTFVFQGDGGAVVWMEGLGKKTPGVTCHSASRCVGMEVSNATLSLRAEFNIHGLQKLVGNDLFVSVWLYLPADWNLYARDQNNYELANPFFTEGPQYLPYAAIHIDRPDLTKNLYNIKLDVRDVNNNLINYATVHNYALPRGQWFNLQYYVHRDVTNGTVMVWINGSLLLNVTNISTKNPSNQQWYTTIGKIYDLATPPPYYLWVDDLQISNGEVSMIMSGVPSFPLESLVAGFALGLLFVIMRRRQETMYARFKRTES